MNLLKQAESLLAQMSDAEKAQFLQRTLSVAGGKFPGIESHTNICGGEPCIAHTRIPVWELEQARRLGIPEAEILKAYPILRAKDLTNAWAYVAGHPHEINEQIRVNTMA